MKGKDSEGATLRRGEATSGIKYVKKQWMAHAPENHSQAKYTLVASNPGGSIYETLL